MILQFSVFKKKMKMMMNPNNLSRNLRNLLHKHKKITPRFPFHQNHHFQSKTTLVQNPNPSLSSLLSGFQSHFHLSFPTRHHYSTTATTAVDIHRENPQDLTHCNAFYLLYLCLFYTYLTVFKCIPTVR